MPVPARCMDPTVLSLFSGAGGLDLGFESAGFRHLETVDNDAWCVDTLRKNRSQWNPLLADMRTYEPERHLQPDVLIAGPPCQGFSLGGNRSPLDERNGLFQQVLRVAEMTSPRIVLIENVLNLRTMVQPETGRPFSAEIVEGLERLGYEVLHDFFRVFEHGVPQTRRRFVFVGFRGGAPLSYSLPAPGVAEIARPWLADLAAGEQMHLPNHQPTWGFRSAVHTATGRRVESDAPIHPIRISRTASDGHPIRSLDAPFPAVDTATIWGWAQGDVSAQRMVKDRKYGSHIRNPESTTTLWRINASRMRAFTHREYARLQTFPDHWEFVGGNRRDVHKQIGNAVPVRFAELLARGLRAALDT